MFLNGFQFFSALLQVAVRHSPVEGAEIAGTRPGGECAGAVAGAAGQIQSRLLAEGTDGVAQAAEGAGRKTCLLRTESSSRVARRGGGVIGPWQGAPGAAKGRE